MPKEIYISSTPHETRLAIVENDALTEIYYERENEYTLAGSIYNGRVTRVLPGMQSSFVDIGLERDAFLYITDFMEEAGDSADFEGEGGQRGGQRRGGQQQGSREPVTLEGGQAPERSNERSGERSGERSRDRSRGRRDRGSRRPEGESAAPESVEAAPEENYAAPESSAEGAEPMGEGAPGADGSRRWRGRRSRRRGRGQREESRQQANPAEPQAEGGEEYPAEPFENSFEIDGTAEAEELSQEAGADAGEAPVEDFQRGSRRPNFDNNAQSGREERGREDRGRGRRDRGRRGPRGFEPRTSNYGIEESGAAAPTAYDAAPAGEPIILPGESLSKYRVGGEETEAAKPAAAAQVIAVSAPGYEIPAGWDGGLVLPGESLSRRRNRAEAPAAPARPARVAKTATVVEATPEVESAQLVEAEVRSESATVPAVEPKEPAEYEPSEDASVTYRVDPVAPSEFRQSAPLEESLSEEVSEETLVQEHIPEIEEEEVVAQHTELPHAEIEQTEIEQTETAKESAHDVTSIHASGLMESEAPVIDTVEAEATQQAFEPGVGVIEEEAIDDEDYDTTMLHASSVEELDDLDEEETLEGAADLGTMLREMSIDEITSAGLGEEEEDFEEEDAIDDGAAEGYAEEAYADDVEVEESAEETEEGEPAVADGAATESDRQREPERRRGRRDNRRGGRDRSRHSGGDRERGGGRGRTSMQATDLPAISELLKPGQEILVQIAKEPIAKKGARITSHIALPGRFLVFMPTVNHTGVSRKIESDGERRRLKEILLSEKGEAAGGFIVRTAASGASEEELRSDLRFLLNLWADIKQRSEGSKSPALIYHDLNLVERILRDQVTDNFSAIWVDSEDNYERILRFLQRFQPSLIRRVKLYTKETPLFEQFGITEEINKALRSKVWLKSGGSIVINQTEALVAIDINTGKYVGKTARLEDTIVKTNLDAIPEIVRQIRLRDLGGIIIIDFIDMDERKNRNKVMAALEEELKTDRAPSKILQFNDFGLVAITRKRVKQSLERTLSTPCNVCAGTGMVKSPVTVCNDIYIEMRKMSKHLDRGDVMLRVHPDVVKQLKSTTKWLQEMEEMVGKTILVKSDPSLHPEQFDIH
ncbi:MAG: Rne/Rng family ribonuclease [Edaphobacter sp.]|uniref:Rne/Rng family ribonuclease n=1 Tax=Edaphobacter sp. TaxID=1934404 RepID=UPI002382D5F2|nr:Rne/Rng family ribonuclease [Edaphobacter sp.]MDE1177866.1 Rne/Rng family ribonuclease [Edaphobacter sp.]